MKKFSIVMAMILIVMCCSCAGTDVEESMDSSELSQGQETIDLGEILEKEQTAAVASASPAEAEMQKEDQEDIIFPEYEQVITDEDQTEPQGNELQLVFLGDSIFDSSRDGTGVPYLTSVQCEADVYNLAIGGTRASLDITARSGDENWDSRSLVGVVKALTGVIPTDIFEGTRTKEILDSHEVDFRKTDYFIIEYGINDYFEGAPRGYDDEPNNIYTYAGALRVAITLLRSYAPDCTIVLCPPHYCQFFNGDHYVGDSNMTDKGAGTLRDYMGVCEYISNEQQTLFLNTYFDLGIDSYTAEEYLEDGIHLTEKGRKIYADALAKLILSYEEEKNN